MLKSKLVLRQTLAHPVNGYWDGGAKQIFDWSIEGTPCRDQNGSFIRIGSWSANHWFHVALGKTEKQTLAYAKRHLKTITQIESTFEYVEKGV